MGISLRELGWAMAGVSKRVARANVIRKRRERSRPLTAGNVDPMRIDPSRTGMLRTRLIKELRQKFARLRLLIYDVVVTEDAFGLQKSWTNVFTLQERQALIANCGGKGSGIPGPCPSGVDPAVFDTAQIKAKGILARIRSMPGRVVTWVKNDMQKKYTKLEGRYGSKYAKAVVATMVAGLPIPGGTLLPLPIVAIAEAHRYFFSKRPIPAMAMAGILNDTVELTSEQIQQAALQLAQEIYTDLGWEKQAPKQLVLNDTVDNCGGPGSGIPGPCPLTSTAVPKKEKKVKPVTIRGAEGTKLLSDRLAAAGIPIDPGKLVSEYGTTFQPSKEKDPRVLAQFHPLNGGVVVVDSPHLSESEKMVAATHELAHALDHKLGPQPFTPSSRDPNSELGKVATTALQNDKFRTDLEAMGYRGHEMREEAVAYVASRWARKQTGLPVSVNPSLDKVVTDFEKVMMTHAGHSVTNGIQTLHNSRWAFATNPQKVKAFQQWLKQQLQFVVLGKSDEELWQRYTEEGFQKGQARAFDDTTRTEKALKAADEKLDFYDGTRDQFLRSAFGQPVAVEKVKLLASRSFDEMEGMTNDMTLRMSRHLTDGLVQGKSPLDIAKALDDDLDIGRNRAEIIARTEIIRAHAEGQLEALELLGVEEVGVAVEWSTAGDDRVCPLCQPLEGIVLKVAEAHGMLPRHPRCRCAWIPANVGEESEPQKRSQKSIREAIRTSVDRGNDSFDTADPVSAKRPVSILTNRGWQQPSFGLRDLSKALDEFSSALNQHWHNEETP